jgi:hypothetical protein
MQCAACGDSLPPPVRKPGSRRTLRDRVRGKRCRSGRGRSGSPSVSEAAALLPRRRCETLRVCEFTAIVGCDCSRRTVAKLCVTTKPEAAHQLVAAMPFAALQAGKHHAASDAPLRYRKSATEEEGAKEKTTRALWVCCANRGKLVDGSAKAGENRGELRSAGVKINSDYQSPKEWRALLPTLASKGATRRWGTRLRVRYGQCWRRKCGGLALCLSRSSARVSLSSRTDASSHGGLSAIDRQKT